MSIETEFDYLSPYSELDSVSQIETADDSLFISTIEGEEETTSSPDAINIEETLPENENWESVETGSAAIIDSSVSSHGQFSLENDQGEKQTENLNSSDPEGNETLSNIYKLLDERIPNKAVETEALEVESETEVTLKDIHDQIDSIAQYESEQLSIISEIRDNHVVSTNNGYYMDSFQIALTSAIFGSILIGLLFRNIR